MVEAFCKDNHKNKRDIPTATWLILQYMKWLVLNFRQETYMPPSVSLPCTPPPRGAWRLTVCLDDCKRKTDFSKKQKLNFVLETINNYIFLCHRQPVIHCTVANLPNSVWSKYNAKQTYMMISIEFFSMPKSDRRSISPSLKSVLGFEYPNCSAWYSTYLLATST